jgi:hypothetical protein
MRDAIGDIGWTAGVLIIDPDRFQCTRDLIGAVANPAG